MAISAHLVQVTKRQLILDAPLLNTAKLWMVSRLVADVRQRSWYILLAYLLSAIASAAGFPSLVLAFYRDTRSVVKVRLRLWFYA